MNRLFLGLAVVLCVSVNAFAQEEPTERCGSVSRVQAMQARTLLHNARYAVTCSNYDQPGTECEPGSYSGQPRIFKRGVQIVRSSRPGRDQRSLVAFATDFLDLAYVWIPMRGAPQTYVNVATLIRCANVGETPYLTRTENPKEPDLPIFEPRLVQ